MSKYDNYWSGIIENIAELIDEAYKRGRSKCINISDIRLYGKRKSWYGSIILSRNGIIRGDRAHVVALGKMLLQRGLLRKFGNLVFKIVVTDRLHLRVELVKGPEISLIKPTGQKHRRKIEGNLFEKNLPISEYIYFRIHELLELLPMLRYPIRKSEIPSNGIYFFYEDGEMIKIRDREIKRIVRVGTHREQDRLPKRLLAHFQGDKTSSIFRMHIGAAILAKENPSDPRLKEWMNPKTRPFKDVKEKVNKLIREKFSFRYIKVDDKRERLDLEERLISTLAKFSPKYVSQRWLGRYSPIKEIRESGLWNVQHVNSMRFMNQEHLAKLERLVYETLATKDDNGRALILIPCCKSKKVNPTDDALASPLYGINNLRNKLIYLLKKTSWLRKRPKNRRGILNPSAPLTKAIDLYTGRFYKKTKNILLDILNGKYPFIHVLIVSALYGLVKIGEGIKDYDLNMGDKLVEGTKVYKFWQEEGLWRILFDYIRKNKITRIWSLLPNSPQYPYHQVFKELWKILRNTSVECYRVRIPGAGSASGIKRAEWFAQIIRGNPQYLFLHSSQLQKIKQLTDFAIQYLPCHS